MMRKLAVGVAVVAAMGLFTAPAHADNNEGKYSTEFVDGATITRSDDFGEHYREIGSSLCHGCSNSWNTDTVVMWQAILASEGLLPIDDIDGRFGSQTSSATKAWQRRYGLADDGMVGPRTWDKADDQLRSNLYVGDGGAVIFHRGLGAHGEGAYQLLAVRHGGYTQSFDGARIYHHKRTVYAE